MINIPSVQSNNSVQIISSSSSQATKPSYYYYEIALHCRLPKTPCKHTKSSHITGNIKVVLVGFFRYCRFFVNHLVHQKTKNFEIKNLTYFLRRKMLTMNMSRLLSNTLSNYCLHRKPF